MSKLDWATLRAGVLESIEALERQANDPTLPRSVRNKTARALQRRKQLVQRYHLLDDLPEKRP